MAVIIVNDYQSGIKLACKVSERRIHATGDITELPQLKRKDKERQMQQSIVEGPYKKAASFIAILWVLMILAGCSGGSSGPPPTLNYTGVTTPVTIDADNADTLLLGAYEGGLTASVFNILGAARAESAHAAAAPRMLALAGVLETFLYELDMQPQEPASYTGAIITDSETLFGSCGGSVYYDVGLDSIFGDFSGTADFREYCDASNPDLVLDGITDFSGDYDPLSFEIDDFSFIFRDLAVTSGAGGYILNGSLTGSASATRAHINTSSVLQDAGTGKTYWLKDFVITADKGNGFVDIELTGRYYDHDHGYVDVSTEEPFRVYDYADWPASGILAMEGAEGTQGGKTMARLTVLDADSFQVEADTDGDGSFDDYNSGPMGWTEI